MTQNELEQLAAKYAELLEIQDAAKKEADAIKKEIIPELEDVGGKFDFGMMTAAKQDRQGTVDMKKLQIKYSISDMDLDALRKPGSSSWVFRRKKVK